jgi:uncharacterized protein
MNRLINRMVSSSKTPSADLETNNDCIALEQLVGQIARSLVDNPQQVLVTTHNGDNTMVLELRVAKEDIGKVIGRQGRTAQAMRTLLSAVSSKARKRMVFEIIE